MTTLAPSSFSRSTVWWGVTIGTTMVAGTPSWRAEKAAAMPAFPPVETKILKNHTFRHSQNIKNIVITYTYPNSRQISHILALPTKRKQPSQHRFTISVFVLNELVRTGVSSL